MITAYLFRQDGSTEKISQASIASAIKNKNNTVWVDIEQPSEQDYELILNQTFKFHPLSIEDCKRPLELPKVDVFDEHLFIVFHNVSSNAEKGYFKKSEVDFFLGDNFLVSVHLRKSKTIEYLQQMFTATMSVHARKKKNHKIIHRTADFILYEILDNFIDRYFPLLDDWEDEVEQLEMNIIRNKAPNHLLNRLLSIKRELLTMRKSIIPQREVIKKLFSLDFPFIHRKTSFYFKDVYDHIARVYSELEIQRDMINSAFEAHTSVISKEMNIISTRINKVMQKLTVMTAIFLPVTFLTGLFGMNFAHIPGSNSVYGFYILVVLIIAIAIGMLVYFKKNDWL